MLANKLLIRRLETICEAEDKARFWRLPKVCGMLEILERFAAELV